MIKVCDELGLWIMAEKTNLLDSFYNFKRIHAFTLPINNAADSDQLLE